MTETRVENDLLGEIEVPAAALYGAQTQRAVVNFPPAGSPVLGSFPDLVRALLLIKQAAASTNHAIGALTAAQAQAIAAACATIVDEPLYDQFPVHYLHGGGGTSANMNVNEVVANLGEALLGGVRGRYERLHPNDHVNLNQSTNDVYPTACHLAVLSAWRRLAPRFEALATAFTRKSQAFADQKRLARTCLQDAVDITFGDLFGGYAAAIRRCARRLDEAVAALARVNLGGTIVGRRKDVPPAYFERIVDALNELFPDAVLRRADDLFDAAQNLDDLAAVSAQLDLCARTLIKIGKDIRLLASGPEGGLQELQIPAVQPGSSMMPGKINPVIPEFLIQVCFRLMGNHQMSVTAVDHGELDLNVWESPVVFGILESMNLLDTALAAFTLRCVDGLAAPAVTNDSKAQSLIARLTDLAKVHGYAPISAICREADGDFDRIRQLLKARGLDDET